MECHYKCHNGYKHLITIQKFLTLEQNLTLIGHLKILIEIFETCITSYLIRLKLSYTNGHYEDTL